MSMPRFSEIPEITLEDSITQIISSIAMEELALSHIINAEGEKLQYVLGTLSDTWAPSTPPTLEEILEINESVQDMLSSVSMNQMFLLGKMSAAVNAYFKLMKGDYNNDGNGGGDDGGGDSTGIEVIEGATLLGTSIGDTSDWLEIAKYDGAYSLIVRKNFINIYQTGHQGEAGWQHTNFGSTNQYLGSKVRTFINNWFTGEGIIGDQDTLSSTAPLRTYTVKNDVRDAIGTAAFQDSIDNGFSKPLAEHDTNGLDVAFALSYGEAANYISNLYSWGGGQSVASSDIARANFLRLNIPTTGNFRSILLRSTAGTINGTQHVGTLSNYTSLSGRVFRESIDHRALVYPALWVDSAIIP